ncbi:MAG: proline dehydrogenase family protein [Oligoflexales bacterium]
MLDYQNTEYAYAHISTSQLKRERWILRLLQSKSLVQFGSRMTLQALNLGLPVENILRTTLFKKFCVGENLEQAIEHCKTMKDLDIDICYHYSIEGSTSEALSEQIFKEKMKILSQTKGFAALKCTGIINPIILRKKQQGLNLTTEEKAKFEGFKNRLFTLGDRAQASQCALQIDAEESWIQDIIDDLTFQMMVQYNKKKPVIYQTAQMYRHDTLAKLHKWYEESELQNFILAIKLVRGAYHEKENHFAAQHQIESAVHQHKKDTDKDYNNALKYLMTTPKLTAVFAGTHNEESVTLYTNLIDQTKHTMATTSQLYGMADHLTFNCQKQGYPSCKYVPYGPIQKVIPYLIRRAIENSSIQGEMNRELLMIETELKRREHDKKNHELAS